MIEHKLRKIINLIN